MTRHLLDTDSVIDILYAIGDTIRLITNLYNRGDSLCICDVVLAEVYAGLHPDERSSAEAFFASLEFLPTSANAARRAGAWRYQFARQGKQLAISDCLIAAVAAAHGAVLVTGNVRDFPMPVLTVLPLPRSP